MNRFQTNSIIIASAAVLISISAAAIITSGTFPSEKITAGETDENNDVSLSVIPAEADAIETTSQTDIPSGIDARVHVLCTGDNLIHGTIYKQAAARANGNGYDFTYEYDNVDEYIKSADIAIINQETLICNDTIEPSDYPYFNSPTALGDHMIDIGFDVFTIANNHVLDQKSEGLSACLDYWESREETNDIRVLGAYRNVTDKENIRTMNKNGIDFSFLAYTEYLNGLKLPDNSEMIIGDANDIDGMKEDIKKAKEISDICIVSLHWGVEDSDEISDSQRETAKALAEAGADVIVGTHPHVLRDLEIIEKSDGSKTLVAYSLGNFVSAQSKPQNLIGGILEFFIDKTGDTYSIDDISLVPTITHYDSGYANNRVYLYSQYTEELAASHGVNSEAEFSMDYIDSILEKNISPEFYSKSN